jgi:hypothetical protein
MKRLALLVLTIVFCLGWQTPAQDRPMPVTLVQLIANPERFDAKLINVRGYYMIVGKRGDMRSAFLYLNQQDADNQIGNGVEIVPSDQMRKEEEKFNQMYISVTGAFHLIRAVGGFNGGVIREVQSCAVWSDPKHPKGEHEDAWPSH